jgi:hypothetical protein
MKNSAMLKRASRRYLPPLFLLVGLVAAWPRGGSESGDGEYATVAPTPPLLKQDESRSPLFRSDEVLELELVAPFGEMTAPGSNNPWRESRLNQWEVEKIPFQLDVNIKMRGKSTRDICQIPRLRLRVLNEVNAGGTAFEAASTLKMLTHCGVLEGAEHVMALGPDAVRREAHMHRMLRVLFPAAPRTRLMEISYLEPDGSMVAEGPALFLEPNETLAERLGGELVAINTRDDALDRSIMDPYLLAVVDFFEILVLNFDYHIYDLRPRGKDDWGEGPLHNIVGIELPDGRQVPIPWDFDRSFLARLEDFPVGMDSLLGHPDGRSPRYYLLALELQRWRARHPRHILDAVRSRVRSQMPSLRATLDLYDLDKAYREVLADHLSDVEALLEAEAFYRRTVTSAEASLFEDPFGTRMVADGGLRGAILVERKHVGDWIPVDLLPLKGDPELGTTPVEPLSGFMHESMVDSEFPAPDAD